MAKTKLSFPHYALMKHSYKVCNTSGQATGISKKNKICKNKIISHKYEVTKLLKRWFILKCMQEINSFLIFYFKL
jgi:hypothetical protein